MSVERTLDVMSSRKIITFLGRRPQTTKYAFAGIPYCGSVFAEAMCQFIDFDQMLVCVTEEARADSWPVLTKLNDHRIKDVDIPRGESIEEMWDIFRAILKHIEPQDTVIFDITHGLRSLPFLVFLFAAYLKTARQVTIEAIYYAALELGDRNANKPAPVIDLSKFVVMLDWLTATDQFIQTGNARHLAKLIGDQAEPKGTVKKASEALIDVSQAAFLCQPFSLMRQIGNLELRLMEAEADIRSIAPPFDVLRDQITASFNPLKAEDSSSLKEKLAAEYHLIEWYHKNDLLVQACTLAREWLLDSVAYCLNLTLEQRLLEYKEIENAVNGIAKLGQETKNQESRDKFIFSRANLNEYGQELVEQTPQVELEMLRLIWNEIAPVRNLFDHAEHQRDAMKYTKAVKKFNEKVMPTLSDLASRWNIL